MDDKLPSKAAESRTAGFPGRYAIAGLACAVMALLLAVLCPCVAAHALVDTAYLVPKADELGRRVMPEVRSGRMGAVDVSDLGIADDTELMRAEMLAESRLVDEWATAMYCNGILSADAENGRIATVRPVFFDDIDPAETAGRQRVAASVARFSARVVKANAKAECAKYGRLRFSVGKGAAKKLKRKSKLKGRAVKYDVRLYSDRKLSKRLSAGTGASRSVDRLVGKRGSAWVRYRVKFKSGKKSKWSRFSKPQRVKLGKGDVWKSHRALREAIVSEEICRHLHRAIRYSDGKGEDVDDMGVYGALCAGSTMCLGYSKAYKAIADELGLNAEVVHGMSVLSGGSWGHAWNRVMVGGKWKWVDLTWIGDEGDFKRYVNVPYGDKRFLREHRPWCW